MQESVYVSKYAVVRYEARHKWGLFHPPHLQTLAAIDVPDCHIRKYRPISSGKKEERKDR